MLFMALVVSLCMFSRCIADAKVMLESRHHGFVEELRRLVNHGVESLDSEAFLRLHEDQLQILEDKTHDTFGKKHHYFVQYTEECGAMPCHQTTISSVGDKNYQFVTSRIGMVYTTHAHLKSLHSEKSHRLLSYIPMTPDTKISGHLVDSCLEYHEHMKTKKEVEDAHAEKVEAARRLLKDVSVDGETGIDASSLPPFPPSMGTSNPPKMPGRILIQGAALPLKEFEAFKELLINIASSYGEGTIVLDMHSFKHARPNEEVYFSFSVPVDDDCAITSRLMRELATIPEIMRVERKHEVSISNRWAKGICQTNFHNYQAITTRTDLDGTDQVVGILDTGIDMSNCYFRDDSASLVYDVVNTANRKVIYYNTYQDGTDDVGGHGTHVAGSVAGNSTKTYGDFVKYNGMAYNAKIAFFDIGSTAAGEGAIDVPDDLKVEAFEDLSNTANAYIISNSWGSAGVDYYNSYCRQSDNYMYANPAGLLLFANGNSGDSGAGTVNSPAGAKNVLSVGASLNAKGVFEAYPQSVPDGVNNYFNNLWLGYFSSRGPTADNRVKPDICAPGWWTVSAGAVNGATDATSQCTIATLQGTSMATPTVAGNMAMVRQYFMDGFYPTGEKTPANEFTPSGALMKAIAIHSASEMVGITKVDPSSGETSVIEFGSNVEKPNNNIGFGRLLLANALTFNNPSTHLTPNNPLSLFVVGAVAAADQPGGTLTDNNLYQACPAPYTGTAYASGEANNMNYFFKTGSEADGGSNSIRITLVWTDPPGTAVTSANGATAALVNQLDIELIECGSSATIVGTGNGTTSAYSANQGGTNCDNDGVGIVATSQLASATIVNPVAMIEHPAASVNADTVYKVRVKCMSINTAAEQPFSLVITQRIYNFVPYTSSDELFPVYKSDTAISIGTVSNDALVIIVIFSIVALVLGVLSSIIYFAHKKADAQDEADLDAQAAQMAALQEQQMAQIQAERGQRRA